MEVGGIAVDVGSGITVALGETETGVFATATADSSD